MSKPRALDLCCGAGGVSEGLRLAGFEVVGVDINPQPHYRGGTLVQGDALTFPLEGFDFIWASPPCQAHTSLRHLQRGKVYPELIAPIRERLRAWEWTRAKSRFGGLPRVWAIENVPGAPLGESGPPLTLLCGTMFGLQTPDGRAELRRHRWIETSFGIPIRPACQHGRAESLTVSGTGMGPGNRGKEAQVREKRAVISVYGPKGLPGLSHARRAISITGKQAQTNTVRNTVRETFSVADARAAMGIDWMPMKYLSQAIPPAYARWIGEQALLALGYAGERADGAA